MSVSVSSSVGSAGVLALLLASLVGLLVSLPIISRWLVRLAERRALAASRREAADVEKAIAALPLERIERVEFYKRDQVTLDLICCDVTTNETPPKVWTFHEEVAGWPRLLAHLHGLLGFAEGWREAVATPAFAENRFVAFARAVTSPAGWTVVVEASDGDLLFLVAEPEAVAAEDIVRRNLGLADGNLTVRAWRPEDQGTIDRWRLQPGEIKGPF